MGATTFFHEAKGKTATEAFNNAREDALYDYGHSGYTGTIAEKHKFTVIPLPEGKSAAQYANELIDADDKRIEDKWGPAGAIQIDKESWLFFGWASE